MTRPYLTRPYLTRPYVWWCLAVVAVQIAGIGTIRHLVVSAFGEGVIAAPDGVVGAAMKWTAVVGIVGVITAIGATWAVLRRASKVEIALGIGCLTTPALLLSGFACMVWAVSLGW